jgi:DNA-binding IclR family transcriptional regulator
MGVNSIEVGLRVLKALVMLGQPAALGEVADAARMHPAKVRRYMVSFIRGGLIKQDPETGRYDLGPYGLDFGLACLERLDAHKIGASVLGTLVSQLNESAFVAVWGSHGATVVDWQPARQPISASTRIGTVFPLLTSSTGRTFLTYLPPAETEPFLQQELKAMARSPHPKAIKDRKDVDQIIAEIRERGLARGTGLRMPGMNSFSAPVFNRRGAIAFTLTLFGYEETFDPSWDGPIAVTLKTTAKALSHQMGHIDPAPTAERQPPKPPDHKRLSLDKKKKPVRVLESS